jgi:quaternary ammonium compound-resistance protein SugE
MSQAMGWLLLVASGLIDVAWAYATKRSDGFANTGWGLASLGFLALFILMLTKALQVLPLGTAYAVWTGIGAVGSLAVGIVLLGEGADPVRLSFAAVVILGIVGLKLTA